MATMLPLNKYTPKLSEGDSNSLQPVEKAGHSPASPASSEPKKGKNVWRDGTLKSSSSQSQSATSPVSTSQPQSVTSQASSIISESEFMISEIPFDMSFLTSSGFSTNPAQSLPQSPSPQTVPTPLASSLSTIASAIQKNLEPSASLIARSSNIWSSFTDAIMSNLPTDSMEALNDLNFSEEEEESPWGWIKGTFVFEDPLNDTAVKNSQQVINPTIMSSLMLQAPNVPESNKTYANQ
jgi:hypothetical protein